MGPGHLLGTCSSPHTPLAARLPPAGLQPPAETDELLPNVGGGGGETNGFSVEQTVCSPWGGGVGPCRLREACHTGCGQLEMRAVGLAETPEPS